MTRLTTHYDGEAVRRFGLATEVRGTAGHDDGRLYGAARRLEEFCRGAARAMGIPLAAVTVNLAISKEGRGVAATIALESPAGIEALLRLREVVERAPQPMAAPTLDSYVTGAYA